MPRELLRSALAKQRLDGIITLLSRDVLRVGTRLRGKDVAALSTMHVAMAVSGGADSSSDEDR